MRATRWLMLGLMMAVAAPVAAQDARPAPPRGETGHSARTTVPIGFLLRHRAEIGLSDQQISRLEEIADRLERQNRPLREQLRASGIPMGPDRREVMSAMSDEQRKEVRERLEHHRPTLIQMRDNAKSALDEARGVLSREQVRRMRALMPRPDQERDPPHRSRRG
jgi:hypothetical protein